MTMLTRMSLAFLHHSMVTWLTLISLAILHYSDTQLE